MGTEDGSRLSRRLHWDGERGTSGTPDTPGRPAVDADGWDERADWAGDRQGADAASFAAAPAVPSFERRDLERIDEDALDRRRQLWRDTALILSGLVAALLVANTLLPELTGISSASPSPAAPGVLVAPSPTGQGAVGATPEPSVAARPDAEPPRTASPGVTLPPTGTHPPATPKPIVTPRPTRPPTAPPPTAPPPTEPPPTPEITPEPPSPPVAAFDWSQSVPLTISFTDSSTGETDWLWDFGDGTGSSQQNPEHLFLAPGDYQVRLTVTGPGGTDSVVKTVSVTDT